MMESFKAEKGLALTLIKDALNMLKDESQNPQRFTNNENETKEFKAAIDLKIEGLIIPKLLSTGLEFFLKRWVRGAQQKAMGYGGWSILWMER